MRFGDAVHAGPSECGTESNVGAIAKGHATYTTVQGVVEVEVGQTKGKIDDHIHNFLSTIAALPVPMYRDRLKGVQILLSNSQAGPGRTVKQEQEEISRNHVQAF